VQILAVSNVFTELPSNGVLEESCKTRWVCCCFLRLPLHFLFSKLTFRSRLINKKVSDSEKFGRKAGRIAFQGTPVPLPGPQGTPRGNGTRAIPWPSVPPWGHSTRTHQNHTSISCLVSNVLKIRSLHKRIFSKCLV